MYYKRSTGKVFIRKTINNSNWVKWVHHSQGPKCCQECISLDGCLFYENKAPTWPHHPNCHCTLDPIGYSEVFLLAAAKSQYSKFDPYLFNTTGLYTHTKEKLFAQWGYTVDDAKWLQAEMERQALEKYLAGDYTLGKLNKDGQRISINGCIQLTTPYGGK